MLPYNINNLWPNETGRIVQCIKAGTKNIEEYYEYRKHNLENICFLEDVHNDIKQITNFWTGKTYVGDKKTEQIKNSFQGFYQALYKLLIAFKTNEIISVSKTEKALADLLLYQGEVYRYLGHGNSRDSQKPIITEFNDIWVSWSKIPKNTYFESKLYGDYIKLRALIDGESYGIDLEPLGVSRSDEKEVVFPTIKKTIISEVIYKEYDFEDEYEKNEYFEPIQYIRIENGNVSVNKTADFNLTLKETFNNCSFNVRDFLFKEDINIRAFVKDLSNHDKPKTLCFYRDNKAEEVFDGTILFAKTGRENFESLSNKNIELITSKLIKADGVYKIYD